MYCIMNGNKCRQNLLIKLAYILLVLQEMLYKEFHLFCSETLFPTIMFHVCLHTVSAILTNVYNYVKLTVN